MSDKEEEVSLKVRSRCRPVLEFSLDIDTVYVRFSRAKIVRTQDLSGKTMDVHVDLDGRGNVVGVECIGMAEMSIHKIEDVIKKKAKVEAGDIDFSKARLEMAGCV